MGKVQIKYTLLGVLGLIFAAVGVRMSMFHTLLVASCLLKAVSFTVPRHVGAHARVHFLTLNDAFRL